MTTKKYDINEREVFKNVSINFLGQLFPLAIGIITIPFIIKGLGVERFGLLSLAWSIIGYFSLFDLGLGRATTKYVAQAIGNGKDDDIPLIVWTSVTGQLLLGCFGTVFLACFTPLVVKQLINIPMIFWKEAELTFYLLALFIPLILISTSILGVLEAKQRFDWVNIIKATTNSLAFIFSLIGALLGLKVPLIIIFVLVIRVLSLLVAFVIAFSYFPSLKMINFKLVIIPSLLTFGGWVTVSNVIGPIMVYFDRFLIVNKISLSSVAYYTAPYDIITRLLVIPYSFVLALFPTFSTLEAKGDKEKLCIFFARSIKYQILILGGTVLAITLFAKELLLLWLGPSFAEKSSLVLQVLAIGIFLNSLAQVPYTFLQGIGRPDITAKFHLFELPIYLFILWFFVDKWGILGAAIAWTTRVTIDAILLFYVSSKFYFIFKNGVISSFLFIIFSALIAVGLKIVLNTFALWAQVLAFTIFTIILIFYIWRKILDEKDRLIILRILKIW